MMTTAETADEVGRQEVDIPLLYAFSFAGVSLLQPPGTCTSRLERGRTTSCSELNLGSTEMKIGLTCGMPAVLSAQTQGGGGNRIRSENKHRSERSSSSSQGTVGESIPAMLSALPILCSSFGQMSGQ